MHSRQIEPQPPAWNVFTTPFAIAVIAVVDPLQRRVQAARFGVAAGLLGLGHGLILQCIHPAQPPDRLLIQKHHRLTVAATRGFDLYFRQPGADQGSEFSQV